MRKKAAKVGLDQKLAAYAAAAAGVMTVTPAANAAIHYSGPQNIALNAVVNDYVLDLNGDSTPDFHFEVDTNGGVAKGIGMNRAGAGNEVIIATSYSDPARLPVNYLVQNNLLGPRYQWTSPSSLNTLVSTSTSSTYGMFNNETGYIGVRFNIPGGCGQAYGWIQFSGVATHLGSASGTIIDWAYDDACQPILTGATGSAAPKAAAPTLNEYGLMALVALLAGLGLKKLGESEA